MNTSLIIAMGILAFVCLYFAKGKKKKGNNDFREITVTTEARIIRIYDIDEALLGKVVDDFISLYSDNDDIERPLVNKNGDAFELTFIQQTSYISMCYWVNYLVYCDENKQHKFTVRGWYPFGEVTLHGERQTFSGQTVMMYVEHNDKNYDNISFVTPDNIHYRQPFAISDNLECTDDNEKYEEYKQ